MSALAEESLQPTSLGRRLLMALGVLVLIALVLALGWWLKGNLGQDSKPHKQVARITILPDTPPPPPPPPPRDEPKPQPRDNKPPPPDAPPKPQPVQAPPNAPIKMEGAAGDGPSAFAAGAVANEYKGGVPSTAPAASGGGSGVTSDRAQDRFYAQSARQMLQGEIERHLQGDAAELTASFAVWIERSGAIERYELVPSSNARHDTDLRAALDEARKTLRLPTPPAALSQPMRFRLTVRPQG